MADNTIYAHEVKYIIYYTPLDVLTNVPYDWDCDKRRYSYKIEVNDIMVLRYKSDLEKIFKELKTLKKQNIKNVDLRVYYEIYSDDKKILSVGLDGRCMVINKIIYKLNIIFYNFVSRFIPNREYNGFKLFISEIK